MLRSLAVFIFALAWCWAADDSVPASSNVRGAQYPRVSPYLRVTFRLKAPDARKVQLHPGGDGLGKGDLVWRRATTASGPSPPGPPFRDSITTGFWWMARS